MLWYRLPCVLLSSILVSLDSQYGTQKLVADLRTDMYNGRRGLSEILETCGSDKG